MNVNKRVRRTPKDAKHLILETAASRLSEFGLEGLNISGVAKAAGMSHATVIHHFGSTSSMRQALLQQMTEALLSDVVLALNKDVPPDQVLNGLFQTLSQDGHGRLLQRGHTLQNSKKLYTTWHHDGRLPAIVR